MKRLIFASLFFSILGTVTACDTSARINFQRSSLKSVHSAGFTYSKGECSAPSKDSLVMRFVMAATNEKDPYIALGDNIDGAEVAVGVDDVKFAQTSVALSGTDQCSSGACPLPSLVCRANDFTEVNSCSFDANLTINQQPKFVSKLDRNQTIVLLNVDSASVYGLLPGIVKNGTFDTNNDGTYDWTDAAAQLKSRVTDPANTRKSFTRAFVNQLTRVSKAAKERWNINTKFGLYSFNSVNIKSYGNSPKAYIQDNFDGAQAAYTNSNSVEEGYRNVIEAIDTVVSKPGAIKNQGPVFSLQAQGDEKILVVLTDGPDEDRADPSAVIKKLKDNNIKVFIVHVDVPVPASADLKKIYPDLFTYYQKQTPCTDDADCKSFESCREAMKFKDNKGTEFGGKGNKYCLINRDKDGRVGPVDDFSQIACETGGGYIYLPKSLNKIPATDWPSWLPAALDGLWEAPVYAREVGRDTVNGKPYLFSTSLSVHIGKRTVNEIFSSSNTARPAIVIPKSN